MAKRKPKRPVTKPPADIAEAMAYAKLFGDNAASEKFGISVRTLHRRRAEVIKGQRPELALLVEQRAKLATMRSRDLLTETYEAALKALAERIAARDKSDRMKDYNLIGAIGILGSQKMTRDMVEGEAITVSGYDADEQPNAGDRGGPPSDQTEGRDPGAQAGGPGSPVH
jgi:hypothetical protein